MGEASQPRCPAGQGLHTARKMTEGPKKSSKKFSECSCPLSVCPSARLSLHLVLHFCLLSVSLSVHPRLPSILPCCRLSTPWPRSLSLSVSELAQRPPRNPAVSVSLPVSASVSAPCRILVFSLCSLTGCLIPRLGRGDHHTPIPCPDLGSRGVSGELLGVAGARAGGRGQCHGVLPPIPISSEAGGPEAAPG